MEQKLKQMKGQFSRVLRIDGFPERGIVIDMTAGNREFVELDKADLSKFGAYVKRKIIETGASYGIGRYLENRVMYDHFDLFAGQERRTVHLGIDLWVEPGTEVFAPLDGRVHSFQNNAKEGDYGPTIILEHELDGVRFHTLYGHLTIDSLEGLREGSPISAGQLLARIGNYPFNGNWPPHLHFQLIGDMQGYKGDFPGVSAVRDVETMSKNSPNPNLILGIPNIS